MTCECNTRLGKYVNMRNASRFETVPTFARSFLHADKQELRYKKAYALLFKILYQNILKWWD